MGNNIHILVFVIASSILDQTTNFQKNLFIKILLLYTYIHKMEARMLKITKIVRTSTAATNNSLIGRNIRNTYQPEILKHSGQKNYFANNNNTIITRKQVQVIQPRINYK